MAKRWLFPLIILALLASTVVTSQALTIWDYPEIDGWPQIPQGEVFTVEGEITVVGSPEPGEWWDIRIRAMEGSIGPGYVESIAENTFYYNLPN